MMARGRAREARAMDKSPDAFRTISEVAEDLDLPQHVLRFWETRFAADQAAEARRRAALLPSGRRRPPARASANSSMARATRSRACSGSSRRTASASSRRSGAASGPSPSPPPGADEADEGALFEAESSAPTTPALWEDSGLGWPAPAPETPRNVLPSANSEPRSAGLSPADVQRLRAALGELVECERVLAALRIFDDLQSERPT